MAGIKLSLIDKQSDKILANYPDNVGALQYSFGGGGHKFAIFTLPPTTYRTALAHSTQQALH